MEFIRKSRLLLRLSFLSLVTSLYVTDADPVQFSDTCKEQICKQWEQIDKVDVEGKFTVGKYRSKRTGLTVFLSRTKTPIVNGYFCLATEAFDNDGLPHTLEHLIFRGSEDYPYKDTLNNLAARYKSYLKYYFNLRVKI